VNLFKSLVTGAVLFAALIVIAVAALVELVVDCFVPIWEAIGG